jgi:hypothetical protein
MASELIKNQIRTSKTQIKDVLENRKIEDW